MVSGDEKGRWHDRRSFPDPPVASSVAGGYHELVENTRTPDAGTVIMKVPRRIYWSCRENVSVDLTDPRQRAWWLSQVLSHGTMADIRTLDLDEVRKALPDLNLPRHVRALWRDYFERQDSVPVSQEGS